VFNDSGKYGFEEEGRSDYFLAGDKEIRNKTHRSIPSNNKTEEETNHSPSKSISKKNQRIFSQDPIREDKVKSAKIKKQRGDYSSEEVYRKIADKLMDLFGIK
jgi:hypothetical protein